MADAFNIPSTPIETAPRGFRPGDEQSVILLDTLRAAGVELGAYDRRIANWLSGWEWSTVATITSWVARASAGHAADRAQHRDEVLADYDSAHRCEVSAEAAEQSDPVAILTAYADALPVADGIGAQTWSEAIRWAAARVRGGHASLQAHRDFRQRFGQIAEHCGAGPWDGTELAAHTITAPTTQEN
ncbi:hypothetical protein [Kitasatospora viridis]|uniref:Uncharacterized protein n=1 Tax=Kitasatospora viridis TaxID=281105 RepID=A0A561UKQ9_9ACTN|nr:hypothetical protein [Kitasatospora viridis]TWF99947.1 hypothetical protein FHX73_113807 [Kitasatospora viridis]